MDKTKFLINTDDNIQKEYVNITDSVFVEGTSGSMAGTYTYSHNLGYIPACRSWYEGVNGLWFPLTTLQLMDDFTSLLDIMGTMTVTSQDLILNMQNFGSSNATVNVAIRIYLDA